MVVKGIDSPSRVSFSLPLGIETASSNENSTPKGGRKKKVLNKSLTSSVIAHIPRRRPHQSRGREREGGGGGKKKSPPPQNRFLVCLCLHSVPKECYRRYFSWTTAATKEGGKIPNSTPHLRSARRGGREECRFCPVC